MRTAGAGGVLRSACMQVMQRCMLGHERFRCVLCCVPVPANSHGTGLQRPRALQTGSSRCESMPDGTGSL